MNILVFLGVLAVIDLRDSPQSKPNRGDRIERFHRPATLIHVDLITGLKGSGDLTHPRPPFFCTERARHFRRARSRGTPLGQKFEQGTGDLGSRDGGHRGLVTARVERNAAQFERGAR